MKKVFAVLLAVLMVAAIFAGCQAVEEEPEERDVIIQNINDEKYVEIQNAIYEQTHLVNPWFSEGYGYGMFYLGTVNGYDIIYLDPVCLTWGEEDGHPDMTLGDVRFEGSCRSEFWTYKNGAVDQLQTVYEEGKISQAVIPQLKEIYADCYQQKMDATEYRNTEGYARFERDYWYLIGEGEYPG